MGKEMRTLEELDAEAARFVGTLAPKEGGATLVTLSGELGAGKTAFTQAAARALGVGETVTSPTFVLEKIYKLSGQKFMRLIHIDAYRLEEGSDLAPLGFDEILKDPSNLIMLEWPEKVRESIPTPAQQISFTAHTDGTHTISYD